MLKILFHFLLKLNLYLKDVEKVAVKSDVFEDFMVVATHVLVNCGLLTKKLIKKCVSENKKKFKSENYLTFESQF
jgi:hypothetical protein